MIAESLRAWLSTLAEVIVASGVAFGVWQRVVDRRAANARAHTIMEATARSEQAAKQAANRAGDAVTAITAVAVNVEKINGSR